MSTRGAFTSLKATAGHVCANNTKYEVSHKGMLDATKLNQFYAYFDKKVVYIHVRQFKTTYTRTSSGPDNIPCYLLRTELAPVFSKLFQEFVDIGIFSEPWKTTRVLKQIPLS